MTDAMSTLGIRLFYGVEKTKNVRPTTKADYIELKGIKSIPSLDAAPDTLETTDMNQTSYKTYINGLKDLGGALDFTFNLSQEFVNKWDSLMEAYEAARTTGLHTWFMIDLPELEEAYYFVGEPAELGLPELGVNEVAEATVHITPNDAPIREAKPTA